MGEILRGLGANGEGTGAFATPVAYPVGASPPRLIATDLDGDGVADLAVANNGSGSVSVPRGRGADGRGDGTFSLSPSPFLVPSLGPVVAPLRVLGSRPDLA